MADIGAALESILTSNSGVSALISTRIYAVALPNNPTLPCVVYSIVSDPRDQNIDVVVARVQFSIFSTTAASCRAVKAAIRSALHQYSGVVSGTHIKMCTYLSSAEHFDQNTEVFMLPVDFQAVYLDP